MAEAGIVAIHQPNFFPWLGYFDKIARSDFFVFLDDVQFPKKKGGTWSNRVRLLVAGEAKWVTVPISREFHGVRSVNEITIRGDIPWREKLLKTVKTNYAKAPCYREALALLNPLIQNPENNLARFNMHAVYKISEALELTKDVEFVCASNLDYGICSGTERLISIVEAVGGNAYLCGGGADGYQEDSLFAESGIELIYQRFEHPVYRQLGGEDFVVGLSVMDALFNLGIEGTAELFAEVRRGH